MSDLGRTPRSDLEHYIPSPERRAAWEQNVVAPFLEEAASYYREQGHRRKYAQDGLRYMVCLGEWLQKHRVPMDQVTESHTHDFLDHVIPRCNRARDRTRFSHVHAAAGFLLRLIRERYPLRPTPSPVQAEIDRYVEHLRRDRGLAEGSIAHHYVCLGDFLTTCFGRGEVRVEEISIARLQSCMERIPRTLRNSRRVRMRAALRGYLRFLQLQGIPTSHLQAAVPQVPTIRAALSPKVLTPGDVAQLLGTVDRTKPGGKRDYAALLCMVDLGMRVGDVARLTLDDLDWRAGTIVVANHKPGRPYRLPLPRRLGDALADYLMSGRPPSDRREVFVRHARPWGIATTAHALKNATRHAWQQAGLYGRFSGTHILRHTAATRMKQEGIGLKSIADVLGHRSLQTTALYAQVDLPALRRTAQPWPEGA